MSDEVTKLRAALRDDGWVVAIHNDYRLGGIPMTFWLFTRDDRRWIKGEGMDDQAALRAALKDSQRPDVRAGLLAAKLEGDRERDTLRAALTRIAEYETDWTKGPDANVAALQAIAETALEASREGTTT